MVRFVLNVAREWRKKNSQRIRSSLKGSAMFLCQWEMQKLKKYDLQLSAQDRWHCDTVLTCPHEFDDPKSQMKIANPFPGHNSSAAEAFPTSSCWLLAVYILGVVISEFLATDIQTDGEPGNFFRWTEISFSLGRQAIFIWSKQTCCKWCNINCAFAGRTLDINILPLKSISHNTGA